MLHIKQIENEAEFLPVIRQLFTAYYEELAEDLTFQKFDEELKSPLKKYGPPCGSLFIAWNEKTAIGCIALQKITDDTCEMKRLFVLPQFRKDGAGKALIEALLDDAKEKRYSKMVLDTLDRLHAAIRLYAHYGFKETTAYYANPIPGVVYMEKIFIE